MCVNPYREPGMERYWIPSTPESALFGTKITDRFYEIDTGGDIAFLTGVLKHLVEQGWVERDFVAGHTSGYAELERHRLRPRLGDARGGRRPPAR